MNLKKKPKKHRGRNEISLCYHTAEKIKEHTERRKETQHTTHTRHDSIKYSSFAFPPIHALPVSFLSTSNAWLGCPLLSPGGFLGRRELVLALGDQTLLGRSLRHALCRAKRPTAAEQKNRARKGRWLLTQPQRKSRPCDT